MIRYDQKPAPAPTPPKPQQPQAPGGVKFSDWASI